MVVYRIFSSECSLLIIIDHDSYYFCGLQLQDDENPFDSEKDGDRISSATFLNFSCWSSWTRPLRILTLDNNHKISDLSATVNSLHPYSRIPRSSTCGQVQGDPVHHPDLIEPMSRVLVNYTLGHAVRTYNYRYLVISVWSLKSFVTTNR